MKSFSHQGLSVRKNLLDLWFCAVRYALCVGALTFALCSAVQAQQHRVYRIGVVTLGSSIIAEISGLRDGLKEAG